MTKPKRQRKPVRMKPVLRWAIVDKDNGRCSAIIDDDGPVKGRLGYPYSNMVRVRHALARCDELEAPNEKG